MKKVLNTLLIASLTCLMFVSCSKSNSTPSSTSTNETATNNPSATIIAGNWLISSYTQRLEDKTSQFAGIVFNFSSAGKMTATSKTGAIESGTWAYSPSSVVYYGATPTKASMNINMGISNSMKNLAKTWNILSNNATTLSLINPEPVDNEQITFTKQ